MNHIEASNKLRYMLKQKSDMAKLLNFTNGKEVNSVVNKQEHIKNYIAAVLPRLSNYKPTNDCVRLTDDGEYLSEYGWLKKLKDDVVEYNSNKVLQFTLNQTELEYCLSRWDNYSW